ncbi:MAG: CCA tRNA nucleotidyltransferase [Phycisphaeraceae bacterium]|nr:CCA tRNA nucleotidyltransferase [Phycisphaeraceae bacterium]
MSFNCRISPMFNAAVKTITILKEAGYTAYLAGGCVRDRLLNIEPKDFDVATNATPDQLGELFHNTQLVGEAFGVTLVRLMNTQVEVATFRMEWGYTDGRHPDGVCFTDAQNDAQRRDFTINGLFEDPLNHQIIDYIGGQEDLKKKTIRAIGDPDKRFSEDYLRLLRAVRFASRLDFEIETKTARAIRNHARYLGQISRKRIGLEIEMMFGNQALPQRRERAARLIQQLHLDGTVLNEDHHNADLTLLSALPAQVQPSTALAAWMLDRHACSGVELLPFLSQRFERTVTQWRNALAMSNELRDALADTLLVTGKITDWPNLNIAQKKRLLAKPYWTQGHLLFGAMKEVDDVVAILAQIGFEAPALWEQGVNPQPWITGSDLIDLGLKPCPKFGDWLDAAYDAQLDGTACDRQQALSWLKKQILSNPSGFDG